MSFGGWFIRQPGGAVQGPFPTLKILTWLEAKKLAAPMELSTSKAMWRPAGMEAVEALLPDRYPLPGRAPKVDKDLRREMRRKRGKISPPLGELGDMDHGWDAATRSEYDRERLVHRAAKKSLDHRRSMEGWLACERCGHGGNQETLDGLMKRASKDPEKAPPMLACAHCGLDLMEDFSEWDGWDDPDADP